MNSLNVASAVQRIGGRFSYNHPKLASSLGVVMPKEYLTGWTGLAYEIALKASIGDRVHFKNDGIFLERFGKTGLKEETLISQNNPLAQYFRRMSQNDAYSFSAGFHSFDDLNTYGKRVRDFAPEIRQFLIEERASGDPEKVGILRALLSPIIVKSRNSDELEQWLTYAKEMIDKLKDEYRLSNKDTVDCLLAFYRKLQSLKDHQQAVWVMEKYVSELRKLQGPIAPTAFIGWVVPALFSRNEPNVDRVVMAKRAVELAINFHKTGFRRAVPAFSRGTLPALIKQAASAEQLTAEGEKAIAFILQNSAQQDQPDEKAAITIAENFVPALLEILDRRHVSMDALFEVGADLLNIIRKHAQYGDHQYPLIAWFLSPLVRRGHSYTELIAQQAKLDAYLAAHRSNIPKGVSQAEYTAFVARSYSDTAGFVASRRILTAAYTRFFTRVPR